MDVDQQTEYKEELDIDGEPEHIKNEKIRFVSAIDCKPVIPTYLNLVPLK